MTSIRYTLVSDGVSDRALIPVLSWLVSQHLPGCAIQSEWADLRRLPSPPVGMANRLRAALDLYPCDLLFVHRDAENQPAEQRLAEVDDALRELGKVVSAPVVAVIPMRMQEAWLLFDEAAVRRAAGNPNGRQPVELPPISKLEAVPDPKSLLHRLLRSCSGLHGRRLNRFPASARAVRVADFIADFSPLRRLKAFVELETRLVGVLTEQGWKDSE